jgi:hypothetical protein
VVAVRRRCSRSALAPCSSVVVCWPAGSSSSKAVLLEEQRALLLASRELSEEAGPFGGPPLSIAAILIQESERIASELLIPPNSIKIF